MGCGVSKFEVEEEDPKSVHVRRSDRHARIPKTKVEEDDVIVDHEEHVRVMKRVGANERPGVVVEKDNINREDLIEPKKVVVVVPPPTVQVVYGGDVQEETPGREDYISCNPGSPSFRDYCIAHDSGDDEAEDEEFVAKEEKIFTKEGLLKGDKVSGTRATRRRRVRGLRSVLHRGSARKAS